MDSNNGEEKDSNVIVCDAVAVKKESLTFSKTETKIEMEEIVPKSEVPIPKVSNNISDPVTKELNFAADEILNLSQIDANVQVADEIFDLSQIDAKVKVEKMPAEPIFMIINRKKNTDLKTFEDGTSFKTVISNEITTLVMDVNDPEDWMIKLNRVQEEKFHIDEKGEIVDSDIQKNAYLERNSNNEFMKSLLIKNPTE